MKTAHELFKKYGVRKCKLATALNITHGSVSQWKKIPADRVRAVNQFTGIPLAELRPDLFQGVADIQKVTT